MSVFFTGFPGFIAGNIIKKMASSDPALRFELLVHPSQTGKARAEVSRLVEMGYGPGSRFSLIPGDITQEGLGFDHSILQRLKKDVTHVFHLAALYDLAVPREIAYRVNVTGTRHEILVPEESNSTQNGKNISRKVAKLAKKAKHSG